MQMCQTENVLAGIWKLTFGQPEAFTPTTVVAHAPKADGLAKLPHAPLPFSLEDISFTIYGRGCRLVIPMGAEEHIYGFGLQMKSFDQKGKKKTLRVNSDPVSDTGDSHAPVPFYVSTAGYGVLVDTARYASFYAASHEFLSQGGKPLEEAAALSDNTESLYASRQTNGGMVVDIPTAKGVSVYLFEGPQLLTAVQRYMLFSGGGAMPPIWGLGVWYRAYVGHNQEQVMELADTIRRERLPCDVFGLEPGWQTASYSCSHAFSPERFPAPADMVGEMAEKGFRMNLWEHVFTHPTAAHYQDLLPYSGDVKVWGGLVPDLSIPRAREIFGGYHEDTLIKMGIRGFKLDECDNSDFIASPWSFPEYSQFPSGMDGEQMHAMLGMLYEQTLWDVFRKNNIRVYQQSRSSHALAASYPFVLYSDLYDHKDFIRSVCTAPFSGLLWSPEVRQCDSPADLLRRVESVVFSPQALVNAWMIPQPPWWQVNVDRNLAGVEMEHAAEITAVIRQLFELRMRFIPYLYAAFFRYYEEGIPPFRPLVMDYPDDSSTYAVDDAWMMGDRLLVAPLTAAQSERSVYLPHGDWIDFWTGQIMEGGKSYTVSPPVEQIPLFVKAGSLLPLAVPQQHMEEVWPIEVWQFGQGDDAITLLEDDGVSYDFEKGSYNRVIFQKEGGRESVSRQGTYPRHRIEIVGWFQAEKGFRPESDEK